MNKIFRNLSLVLVAGALAVSCADYNETDNFSAEPDPSYVAPYKDLAPVKTYIDRATYPNMALGAQLSVTEFNKQELAHAAAVTNFDDVAFGTTLMSGAIVNSKGVMNFLDMKDLLDHAEEIGCTVYGSPLFANANQADDWLNTLTAPIEITVDYVEGKSVDFNEMPLGAYSGTVEKGKAEIVNNDDQNVLKISASSSVRIIEDFEVDPLAKYTTTFWAKADKDILFNINFSGTKVTGSGTNGKWALKQGSWKKFVIEAQSSPEETEGYLRIETDRGVTIYIQKAQVGYYPDNHRPQTAQELSDTINYAVTAWCEGVMKINEGRITTFDLIDEPIDVNAEMENGKYDIKHSTEKIFWQDILGSENYAPVVSKEARKAYEAYEGDASKLKFFISETGLEDAKKFESLKYWIDIWDKKGAKIDGINAKLSLIYSEDKATQEANKATLNKLLDNLAATGKQIRLSNFDIKYQDAEGVKVAADKLTDDQRQQVADYYAYILKQYMTKIPNDKQAGICKSYMVDNGESVGLWAMKAIDNKGTKDWVRTAVYESFCKALGGQ